MRILFVGTSGERRGTETHLVTLCRALAVEGHAVAVVARGGGYIDRAVGSGIVRFDGHFRNALDVSGWAAVREAIGDHKPDWLLGSFGHEYWPLIVLGNLTGARVGLFRHLSTRLKWSSRALLPRCADRFFVVSQAQRRRLAQEGAPADRLSLLPNPVDLKTFRPDAEARSALRTELGLPEGALLMGYVGPLTQGKGAFLLGDALAGAMPSKPSLHVLWVGDRTRHAELADRLPPPLRNRHHLRDATDRLDRIYPALDVLAFPSLLEETFGRVAVEAQACGVPVLASDRGGIPETLRPGETGWLLPPGERSAWVGAIASLEPSDLWRRRDACVAFVHERFDARKVAQTLVTLLES